MDKFITFSTDRVPLADRMFGDPVESFCIYKCKTGCMYFSEHMVKHFDFIDRPNPIFALLDDGTPIPVPESYLPVRTPQTIAKQRYPDIDSNAYLQWISELISYENSKPSESHFLIVIKGFGVDPIFESSYGNQNEHVKPCIGNAFWTERWPTIYEVISMFCSIPNFAFGIPPSYHQHGN